MMRRRTLQVRRLTSLVVTGVTLAGAAACAPSEPTAPPAGDASYSGEAFLRGVFFGDGPVGAMLPEFWQGRQVEDFARTPAEARRVLTLREGIVARLRAADPGYFDRFAAAMRSGRHLEIERALDDAAERMAGALPHVAAGDPTLRPNAAVDQVEGEWIFLVVHIAGAVYKAVAVYQYYAWPVTTGTPESALMRDRLVNVIAARFASPPQQ